MKADLIHYLAALAALLGTLGAAQAQDISFASEAASPPGSDRVRLVSGDCTAPCDACPTACGDACDACCGGRWFVDFEATFLRYHRNDNLETDNFFDFAFAPRLALGYMNDDGFGLRGRWWDYDHTGTGTFNGQDDTTIRVDTYNIDFELFQNVQFTDRTSVEFSGGIRYNDFRERVADSGDDEIQSDVFSAVGAIFGLKARRTMFEGAVYARWNTAILSSDHNAVGGHGVEFDQTLTQTEVAFGYERSSVLSNGSLAWWRIGLEASSWSDYVHDNADADDNTSIGFAGLVLGAGLIY